MALAAVPGVHHQFAAQVRGLRVGREVEVRVPEGAPVANDDQVTRGAVGVLDMQERVLGQWHYSVRLVGGLGQLGDQRGLRG
jgi:hypothetical protein